MSRGTGKEPLFPSLLAFIVGIYHPEIIAEMPEGFMEKQNIWLK